MKLSVASALLALTVSFSSFANCNLSTNHPLAEEILSEKGYHIVDRADALYHIEVVDIFEMAEPSCSLGICKSEVKKEIKVSALNSINMKGFSLERSQSKFVVFTKKKGPKIIDNKQEITAMLDTLDEHLKYQYNDCRPLAND